MAIGLVALAAASISHCAPVGGAERLWSNEVRWVIVGEVHGSNEVPAAFANLVCLAANTGRPVSVALEYSVDDQGAIDAYLASNGRQAARSKLLTLYNFTSEMQDGRGSVAFLRLFETLRRYKQAGKIVGVIASDVARSKPATRPRDIEMAAAWTAAEMPADGIVLALVGNVHAMRRAMTLPQRTIVTAGSLMPRAHTVTINTSANGGQEWNCRKDGCGVYDAGPIRDVTAGITFSIDPEARWDATYQLGLPTTAALPALPKNLSRRAE